MALTTSPFRRAGLTVDPDAFERLVMEAVERVLPDRPAGDGRDDLTEPEVQFLERAGVDLGDLAPRDLGAGSPIVRAAAEYAALLASSLTTAEAAERLGVDESRVRQLLSQRVLYGIKGRKAWRIPAFQFDDTGRRLLPGLHLIVPHLADAHPVEVASWFTAPQVDLEGPDDIPLSPRQWLLTGRDPRALVALADEFAGLG